MSVDELLKLAVKAAILAGEEILRIYETDFSVRIKSDDTPVTIADKISGQCIAGVLKDSGIPIISEEEDVPEFTIRKTWKQLWIVDPLDGTKEYIRRNGEFAVNIALVEDRQPVIGVIYAPVLKEIYFAAKGLGGFKITLNESILELSKPEIAGHLFKYARKLPLQRLPPVYTIVASRSHLSTDINDRVRQLENMYGKVAFISVGSSIKQCWVAEGRAHEYPRYGKTMEWDTAAGQCILEESGNSLIDLSTSAPMRYNKENMLNSYFLARHHF